MSIGYKGLISGQEGLAKRRQEGLDIHGLIGYKGLITMEVCI